MLIQKTCGVQQRAGNDRRAVTLRDVVRRRKAGHDALKELTAKTGELIEHLQKTGRLAPCFNLPALDAARNVLEAPHG